MLYVVSALDNVILSKAHKKCMEKRGCGRGRAEKRKVSNKMRKEGRRCEESRWEGIDEEGREGRRERKGRGRKKLEEE